MSDIHFYDSANPSAIPSGVYASVNIGFWTQAEADRMRRVFHAVEFQNTSPSLARICRCIGVEPNAASVAEAIQFCIARHEFGRDDFTVYTSLGEGSDPTHQPGMVGIINALRSNAPGRPFRLWIAEWDMNPGNRPEAEGVKAWAKQYVSEPGGHPYDLSVLYGVNDFIRP